MKSLDLLIPTPRLVEVDSIEIAAPPERIWEAVRHGDLGNVPIVRALFAMRTRKARSTLRIEELVSTEAKPGFQILVDDAPRSLAVGAIGQVWKADIPFVHVPNASAFAQFDRPEEVKVAWSIDIEPIGDRSSRVTLELRVDATDDATWKKFRLYFAVIGPASRLIRLLVLRSLARELRAEASDERRTLPGDELMTAKEQATDAIVIDAPPERIWPWLVQLGRAREIHPELQAIRVGDLLPGTPHDEGGFEVQRIDEGRVLVLGGLVDGSTGAGLPFGAPNPDRFWRATWAFVLEPIDARHTKLVVRARAAFAQAGVHLAWMRPVHHFMESAQLRHLKERAEGRLARDTARDVLEGIGGAAIMVADFLTPFLRDERSHWGLPEEEARRARPGDDLVPSPRWQWTHAVEIDRPAQEVWPWIAQIGADRGGFYSYQWLENLVGCDVRNAEAIHPEWAISEGGTLSLHPKMPPLRVVSVVPGRGFVAYAAPDETARAAGRPWAAVTWAFLLEELGPGRCRLVSRYRCATSDDLRTRVALGPTLVEPIGFAMDRCMLLGIKKRAERQPSV